jgi:hypothetical protein
MSRLKLLFFALPALVLWLADLSLTASSFSEKAEAQAAAYAVRGVDAVSVRVANRRSELQGLALRLGSAPGAWVTLEALRANKPELAAERLGNLRRNASDAVSSALRRELVLGVRTDNGAVFAKGAEPPSPTLAGLETDAVAGAGSDGQTRDAFGKSYLFFSFPLLGSDKEARAQGLLIVGGPLLPEGTADQVALETGLSALGVVQAGKLVSSGGPEKAKLPDALRETPVGKSAVAMRGSASSLGFLKLPLFTSGPEPALRVSVRRGLPGQPLELLALVSTEPAMATLADTQRFALGAMLLLCVGLAVLWFWMGREMPPYHPPARDEETEPGTRRRRKLFALPSTGIDHPVFRAPNTETARTVEPVRPLPEPSREREPIAALPEPVAPPPPPPEAGPSRGRAPLEDLAALLDAMPPPPDPTPAPVPRNPPARVSPSPATPPRPPPKPAPAAPAPLDFDHQPTTAYPVPNLPDFNLPPAAALGPVANAIPEATRVADTPEELIASSRLPSTRVPTQAAVKVVPAKPSVPPDEVHFQDVFHEFLAVRERCGEVGDGLSFEKFAGKLRKNRDQLVKKYGCRTVRFQVYVKDGRAALKATPVRE